MQSLNESNKKLNNGIEQVLFKMVWNKSYCIYQKLEFKNRLIHT